MASKPIPIRISYSLLKEIKATEVALEMTDQDTMRFCMRLGLKILELTANDPITPVAEKALKRKEFFAQQLITEVGKKPQMA